jgi:hypothetical protein
MIDPIGHRLLQSPEPAIRYKTLIGVVGVLPTSQEARAVQQELHRSPMVQALLSERDAETGMIPLHPYNKWRGSHWVLACLADLGYPPGDESLQAMMDQVYAWLLSPEHQKNIRAIDGRVRRCASQEGNALWASLSLGLAGGRSQELAERLIRWQWPDGGWNCDKRPEAVNSSFMESLIPLRALALYAQMSGDPAAQQSVEQSAEVFLKRALFKRRRDGAVIDVDFVRLHYPPYWHYDILFALKVMSEIGRIGDPRCATALDELQAKQLPDGGFPAEGKYYRTADGPGGPTGSGRTPVDWGGVSKKKMNEFVTVDALSVLHAVDRC